jgi:hypothetical protein
LKQIPKQKRVRQPDLQPPLSDTFFSSFNAMAAGQSVNVEPRRRPPAASTPRIPVLLTLAH